MNKDHSQQRRKSKQIAQIKEVSVFFTVLALLALPALTFAESSSIAMSTAPITLQECYQRARQISETIGISAENVKVIQEQYRSEVGSVLPHIDWIKSQFYQQNKNSGASGFGGSALLRRNPCPIFKSPAYFMPACGTGMP